MTSKNKAKGSAYERAIAQELVEHGFENVERMYGAGRQDDRGDIRGLSRWTIEAKDHAKHDLGGWLGELHNEMTNAKTKFGAVLIKKRGKNVRESYCLIPWAVLIELLKETNA